MEKNAWTKFQKERDKFRDITETLAKSIPQLKNFQQNLADNRSKNENSAYKVETPVVYNLALNDITVNDEIKLILVADNPGRREQAIENRRYLVGPSGKIAEKFFRDNPALGIDFRRNVIILNKTPIHTARTVELRSLCNLEIETGTNLISACIIESQKLMAHLLFEFHEALGTQVWITGYSEMKKGGIFEAYTETLKELYSSDHDKLMQLFIYRHFSMNQFTIDLKQQAIPGENVKKTLNRIGAAYRKRILTNII
jgi:hypothetical protein